jgi:hypothetical protein
MRSFFYVLSAVAIAGGALFGTLAVAAGPKEMGVGNKFALAGKIVQGDVAKGGTFAGIYEENGTAAGNGPDHKMHCLGVMQGTSDAVVEQHGYCMETDTDGDQVLWKVTPAGHPLNSPISLATHEALVGTGKYAGISGTLNSTCQVSPGAGPDQYALKCEFAP